MNNGKNLKLAAFLFIAILAGCGGSQLRTATLPANEVPAIFTHHQTFRYIGKPQFFKVPAGVTRIRVIALGANGGGNEISQGGRVSAIITVTPSEKLIVRVGGNGTSLAGGFNGGASGGKGSFGGGGASDVRTAGGTLSDRILVSGGAGGQGGPSGEYHTGYGLGGNGGGKIGGSGGSGGAGRGGTGSGGGGGGSGGTQQKGGSGGLGGTGSLGYGVPGNDGRRGRGGDGGHHCRHCHGRSAGANGGGGGGGYYGGGGGGVGGGLESYYWGGGGGGGGGSSYVEPSATDVHLWQGWQQDEFGLVVFDW